MRGAPHNVIYLNTWSPNDSVVWEGCGNLQRLGWRKYIPGGML